MAGEAQDSVWPLPSFYFKVEIDGIGEIACKEVSGLDIEAQIIEYRHGDRSAFSTIKKPDIKKPSNVNLKKGIFVNGNKFFDWFNTIKRKAVTISLIDEDGNPVIVWKLANAWPMKVTGVILKSDGNESAVESLDIAHEGLIIANG